MIAGGMGRQRGGNAGVSKKPWRSVLQSGVAIVLTLGATGQSINPPPPVGTVRGIVYRKDDGKPGRFASVTLHEGGSSAGGAKPSPRLDRVTVSDINGNFLFDRIPEGHYELLAWMYGYQSPLSTLDPGDGNLQTLESEIKSALVPVDVIAGATTQAICYLESGSEIDGRVVFDDGSPGVGFSITAFRRDGKLIHPISFGTSATETRATVTNDRGEYRIVGLPPGTYIFKATAPSTVSSPGGLLSGSFRSDETAILSGSLNVYSGDVVRLKLAKDMSIAENTRNEAPEIVIPVGKFHQIDGIVSTSGERATKGFVELFFADDSEAAQRTHILANGSFHLSFVYSGEYVLKTTVGETGKYHTNTQLLNVDKDILLPVEVP